LDLPPDAVQNPDGPIRSVERPVSFKVRLSIILSKLIRPSTEQSAMAEGPDPVDSMLDLMRRLPPTNVEENVNALIQICPDYADDLLGSVDQPLKVMTDRETGKDYLACDYNRDGDSYR
jgi:hypothetical protein